MEISPEKPDIVPIGGSVRLISLKTLARTLGYAGEGPAGSFLKKNGVPIEVIGGTKMFNLFSLELALFNKMMPGCLSRILEGFPSTSERLQARADVVTMLMGMFSLVSRDLSRRAVEDSLNRVTEVGALTKHLKSKD